jgi:hypothetical protein
MIEEEVVIVKRNLEGLGAGKKEARKSGRAEKNISFSSRVFASLAAKVLCFPCVLWACFGFSG